VKPTGKSASLLALKDNLKELMTKTLTIVLAIAVILAVILAVMGTTFSSSLPTWCANPDGNGNWVDTPLCTG